VQVHGIPPAFGPSFGSASRARVVQSRTVRLLNGVALDECLDPERYRTRVPIFVPIAQSTERARPKRQVVGENPAGDTIFCGFSSTAECGRAKAETTVRFRPPAPFRLEVWLTSRGACARPPLTCERQRGRQAVGRPQGPPTIFEGIAQSAERMRHMHQVEGANPSALTICPCGVVQTTRLPLMQEITGAKPVRDANFRRVVDGE
jgi:hypothetical protein